MNKFTELISTNGNDVLKRRAESIATNAKIAQQNLLNGFKQRESELKLKIINLTDLAPDSTDSLRPGDKDWNPNQWVEDLQDAKQELYSVQIAIKLAQETYDEYFTEKQPDNTTAN
jgi:hypothetical protein